MEQHILEIAEQDYEAFYSRLLDFERVDSKQEAHCICPVHDDNKTSLHINLETGKWHCKSCGKGGHDPASYYQFANEVDPMDAVDELNAKFDLTPKPHDNTLEMHRKLLNDSDAIGYLTKRGITLGVIKGSKIGWDGLRFHIPIRDFGGNLRNVRQHLRGHHATEVKTISSFSGSGGLRLYPIKKTKHPKIYIFEGEMDTLLAISLGLNAITVTGGAGSWKLEFNKYFTDKEIIICYDIDKAGIDGAKKIGNYLLEVAEKVSIISIPKDGLSDHGDFTDYIEAKGFEEFEKLEAVKFEGLDEDEAKAIVQDIHLGESTNSFYYNKKIRSTAIVTGKGTLFTVPKKVDIKCTMKNGTKCAVCGLHQYGGARVLKIKLDDSRYLKMFRVSDEEQRNIIKRIAAIPTKCFDVKLKNLEATNIEQVAVIPEIDYDSTSANAYISRLVHITGDIPLESNKPYVLEGLVTPNPKTQESTILVYNSTATKDNIDTFEMNDDLKKRLEIFQADTLEQMEAKLDEKYKDYEAITSIYGRRDLFMSIDVIFHSILSFKFQDRLVKRGHVNGLIYGDTRTGKTEAVDNLMAHFRAGDAAGGENVSFAGLVGGVHKVANGEKWGITWKIIPLNDRRLVKIDEFHEMADDDIRKMSELMSSGVANIQKIHNERTMARTRLILVANGKNGKHLSEFQYGCQAIPAIMGWHNEDIARLDFAFAVSSHDVDPKKINEKKKERRKIKTFDSDLSHSLIMWAWSRKNQDVIFTEEAEDEIMKLSSLQVEKYHISIPLVPTAEHAIKLCRIGAAFAAMFFSTNETGNKVIIKKNHIIMAYRFLEKIYTHRAMKFDVYSKQQHAKDRLKDPGQIRALKMSEDTKDLLLSMDKMNQRHIETIFNCLDKDMTRMTIFTLLKNNAVKPYGSNMYVKTPAFIKFLTTEQFIDQSEVLEDI
jgi:hypothetical protein